MIYRDLKKTSIDVKRANSVSKKQTENNKYFDSFISDSIKTLKKRGSTILFSKEQVEAIKIIINIETKYNSQNKWWEVKIKC